MAFKGDTVRLEVRFQDIYGTRVNPDEVFLNIYDEDNTAIQSISLTSDNRVGIGEYFYDFTIPYGVSDFIVYEFSGLHRERPILARDKIHVEFV